MKKMIIFAGAMLLLAAGTVGFFANRPMSAEEALILKNAEAIAQGESILDLKIYRVVVESSTKWTCYPNEGDNACPAPNA